MLISLWNTKKDLAEEKAKAEKKAYDSQGGSNMQSMQNMNPQSMMSQAKGMLPTMPSMPSMGSFKVGK